MTLQPRFFLEFLIRRCIVQGADLGPPLKRKTDGFQGPRTATAILWNVEWQPHRFQPGTPLNHIARIFVYFWIGSDGCKSRLCCVPQADFRTLCSCHTNERDFRPGILSVFEAGEECPFRSSGLNSGNAIGLQMRETLR